MTVSNPKNGQPQVISYLMLRRMVGILGIALPILIVVGTFILGDCREIQNSISDYYHTYMRNVFVGTLCAIALFLFSYVGYIPKDEKGNPTNKLNKDNIAGNLGAIFALGVAFFPTPIDIPITDCTIMPSGDYPEFVGKLHFIFATLLFGTLSYFSLYLFTKGSKVPTKQKLQRNRLYKLCGCIIIACILLIALYFFFAKANIPQLQKLKPVFWLETIALWAFGLSWLTKGNVLFKDANGNSNNL